MNDGQIVLGLGEVLEDSPRSVNAADSSWHVEQTHDRLRRYVGQRRKVFGALRSRSKYSRCLDMHDLLNSWVRGPKKSSVSDL